MASLEKRYNGRYHIVFCWREERRYHSLGRIPEREARSCPDQLAESLRLVDRGLLEVPSVGGLGRFLVSGGKLNAKHALKTLLTLVDVLKLYQVDHRDGVTESSTNSTESIHLPHLLQIIDPKTSLPARRPRRCKATSTPAPGRTVGAGGPSITS
jgi:hypothetical protein